MVRRTFTVDEANALVPVLESVFRSIERKKRRLRKHRESLEVLGLLWGEEPEDESHPDFHAFREHKRHIATAVSQIEQLIQDEVLRRGLRFPVGGVDNGLIDFPTTYEGRWVYLCWRAGEPELSYWHETNGSYGGRRKLTSRERELMGREDDPARLDDSALDF